MFVYYAYFKVLFWVKTHWRLSDQKQFSKTTETSSYSTSTQLMLVNFEPLGHSVFEVLRGLSWPRG